MSRVLWPCATALVILSSVTRVHAQRNGESYATSPEVVRTDYDMRTFIAPLPLNETESKGRRLFAQRCANCHGGTAQRPGPLIGRQTVEKLGDSSVRDKVMKGSLAMPAFKDSLEPARIDEIVAFLKTFTPRAQTPD
jgi:mono/diheme cytochrome c family protein